MDNATILVVDDEPQIRRTLRVILSSFGYSVIEARNGEDAIESVVREHPALVLLDVNMPDMSGLEACGKIRLSFHGPIIMVTVRNAERDKLSAFNSGADDYIVKPFSNGELLARVRAALRRSPLAQPLAKIDTPGLKIDFEARIVEARGERVHLTPKEFEVLRTLVSHQGKPVAYRLILHAVWGPDYGDELEKVRGIIKRIRRKIEKYPARPRYILTDSWYGYRFEIPSESYTKVRKKE